MKNKIKVVCPKCQAKLKLAVEKMKSEVVKFRCPGCSTVLRVKKPADENQEKRSTQQDPESSAKTFDSSEDLQQLASEFDEEMGYVDSQQDELSGDQAAPEPVEDKTDEHIPGQRKDKVRPSDLRKRSWLITRLWWKPLILVKAVFSCIPGVPLTTGQLFRSAFQPWRVILI